jgi:Protein of unknown function (DUF4235)
VDSGGRLWKLFGFASAMAVTIVVRKVVDISWKVGTGHAPPANPEDPEVSWPEAITFAVASGAAIGLARMLAARKAADYYRRSTGRLPEDLQEVS